MVRCFNNIKKLFSLTFVADSEEKCCVKRIYAGGDQSFAHYCSANVSFHSPLKQRFHGDAYKCTARFNNCTAVLNAIIFTLQ